MHKRKINELIRMWEYGWVGGWLMGGWVGGWAGGGGELVSGWMDELSITGKVHK